MNKIKTILLKIYNKFKKTTTTSEISIVESLRARGVTVGENCAILNSYIDYSCSFLITIGNNVTITNSSILTHDASVNRSLGYSKIGKVNIGDNVFIGYGSIVLPNVTIGDNVIVGAGSVVVKNIPSNSVAAGNPAKVIGTFEDNINKNLNDLQNYMKNHTLGKDKTDEEKQRMKEEMQGFGYDI